MSKEALKLALSCIKSSSEYKRGNATFVETAEDIEQALAAPVQPVALKMNGKQLTLGEALDEAIAATERSASKRLNAVLVAAKNALYTTPPAVQPVAMRMPKVGDRVVCIDDESLGTVVYLTAGGSPEIKFDDGSHGTYMVREFAELFGYTTPPAQEFMCSTGLCHYKPAAPVQPVASLKEADVLMIAEAHGIDPRTKGLYGFYIDCISSQPAAQPAPVQDASKQFHEWAVAEHAAQPAPVHEPLSELQKDAANLLFALHNAWPYVHHHCTIESKRKEIQALMVKHGDFADLQPPAAQRPWVGLTDEQRSAIIRHHSFADDIIRVTAAKLKELNT